jgi:hypothetical protein
MNRSSQIHTILSSSFLISYNTKTMMCFFYSATFIDIGVAEKNVELTGNDSFKNIWHAQARKILITRR